MGIFDNIFGSDEERADSDYYEGLSDGKNSGVLGDAISGIWEVAGVTNEDYNRGYGDGSESRHESGSPAEEKSESDSGFWPF